MSTHHGAFDGSEIDFEPSPITAAHWVNHKEHMQSQTMEYGDELVMEGFMPLSESQYPSNAWPLEIGIAKTSAQEALSAMPTDPRLHFESNFSAGPQMYWQQIEPTFKVIQQVPQVQLQMATMTTPLDLVEPEKQWVPLGEVPPLLQPQTLHRCWNRVTGVTRIYWTVDGKKLRGNDRSTVSPLLELYDKHVEAGALPYKMIITPTIDGSTSSSFRKAKGKATVQLKCEAPREGPESSNLTFYLSAGSGVDDQRLQEARGPVTCDFSQCGICGLRPQHDQVWDFLEVMDRQSETFVVCLEVLAPV